MSLVDKYKEELKKEGVEINIQGTKIKKDRTKLFITLIRIALVVPIYFVIFSNYNSCIMYATNLSGSTSSSTTLTGSFYLKCGVNSIMYSVSAALVIFIILLLILKVIKGRMIKKRFIN